MPIWKRQPQFEHLAPSLHQWFQSELGRAVLAAEQGLVSRRLTDCFGYHLLQLSVDSEVTLFCDSRVQRCFKAGPVAGRFDAPFVQCDYDALPFETDSLDVVIVHHVLEFAANPHAVLRELHRVAVPEGRILLVGFNPWSLFGGKMLAGRWRREGIWQNHLLSAQRVTDWLELLGFAVDEVDFGFHRLPLNRARNSAGSAASPWSRRWPLGGVYAVTAIKQVAAFTPLKPRWVKPAPVLAQLPVGKPSTSVGQRRARCRTLR